MNADHTAPKIGSDRAFGFVFSGFFALVSGYQAWHGSPYWWVLACVAVAFAAAGQFVPSLLRPLNVLWFKFGLLLNKIISPLVLGFVFFVVIVPIAWIARLRGKDGLRLKPAQHQSYWILREPPGPSGESMRNQF